MATETERATLDTATLREREFPHIGESIYLNAASAGPLPERARAAVERGNARRARIHELGEDDFSGPPRRVRETAARMIGATPEEIAVGWNTSFGINLAALSLPVERGSAIVVSDREFPANVYPWMAREEARLELVPTRADGNPDEERLLERLDRGDVSIFALSHVQYATGYRADLERFGRLCRERGIWFVVDAIQSLGQVPVDVRSAHVDVLATGGHKWLCGPFGTGFAYVRRELVERMEPRIVGWTSMRSSGDIGSLLDYRWGFRDGARRFEVATLPFPDLSGLAESMELLLETGIEEIERHLARLLAPLRRWIEETPEVRGLCDARADRRSGIVALQTPANEAVHERLRAAGVGCALREQSLRFSPHLYNTDEEVERTVEILEESRGRGWS